MAKSLNFNTSNFKNRKKKNIQTNRVILRNYCTHRHATPLFPIFSWENRKKKKHNTEVYSEPCQLFYLILFDRNLNTPLYYTLLWFISNEIR